jgi:hypothetical protein
MSPLRSFAISILIWWTSRGVVRPVCDTSSSRADGLDATCLLKLSDGGATVLRMRGTHFAHPQGRRASGAAHAAGEWPTEGAADQPHGGRGQVPRRAGACAAKLCSPCEAGTPRDEPDEGGFGTEQCRTATYVLSQQEELEDLLARK